MKTRIITLILSILSIVTNAEEVIFSDYDSELRIKEISYGMPHVKFNGTVTVTGTLIFRLDILEDGKYGEPLFADFIPDREHLIKFPYVISGRYPKVIDDIGIINISKAYEDSDQSKLEHSKREIRIHGTATFEDYTTTIECDSRQYFATLISFKTGSQISSINNKKVSGC